MPNVGTITGSMYLDPSAYIAGLTTAAGATRQFQQGVSTISFAGFNRGMFATTTMLYGLERIMSNMSKGMEEYANMLGRIGTVADLTAASVSALADSMKQVAVYQGVSRTDIMGGMYTAAQAGYGTPAEMRAMASSGARLSRASGKEIDVRKAVDLQSGIRQALGIGMGAVSSNRMNDMLLKGRDIGRWELDQMAHALGIPLTVWGNQFAGKQSGEETLRQLMAVMSVASLAGVSPNMTATGTRRIVEKTVQLASAGKRADPLRNALRSAGFTGKEPILEALNQGGMRYLNTLMNITGGGETSELTRLGYGSRDLLVLTSALRGKGQKLNEAYEELSYGNTAGLTDRYGEKMRKTYDYSRDQLRAQWEITSQQFMQATIPLIGQLTNMLMGLNSVAQSIPDSVKSFMMLLGAITAMRLALNFAGFRSKAIKPNFSGVDAGGGTLRSLATGASLASAKSAGAMMGAVDAQAARLARRQAAAASRSSSWGAGFGSPSGKWVSPNGAPWGTSFTPFAPMMWNEVPLLARGSGAGFGPTWYNSPRNEPMNWVQEYNMRSISESAQKMRDASNANFWGPSGARLPYMLTRQLPPSMSRQQHLMNAAALGQHYLPGQISGAQYSANGYGPSAEARIRWEAYKRGQSVNFDTGSYGSLSPTAQAYFANRGKTPGSMSVREMQAMNGQIYGYGQTLAGASRAMVNSINGRMADTTPSFARQMGMYAGASGVFSNAGVTPKTSAYTSMGIGGSAQVMGAVTSRLMSLGSSIASVLGPLAKFGAVLGVVNALFEGATFKGKGGGGDKLGGMGTWEKKNVEPGVLGGIMHHLKKTGNFAVNHNYDLLGEMGDQYAEEHGYVPDENAKGLHPLAKEAIALMSFNPITGLAGTQFVRSLLGPTSPMGLTGYRKGGINDLMGKLSRENLTPGQVAKMRVGGIDFDKFSSAKGYVEKYMRTQLNKNAPENWDDWFRSNMAGGTQIVEDALKFYMGDISANAQAKKKQGKLLTSPDGTVYTRVGGSYTKVSDPVKGKTASGLALGQPDFGAVAQKISPEVMEALVSQRILSGRQWDIYSGADYTGTGNRRLNWDAGGKDYRGMYAAELKNLDQRFGGFTDRSFSGELRDKLTLQAGGGLRALMGNKGKFTDESGLGLMLDQGDKDFAWMQKVRNFLPHLPNLATMPEEQALKLFTELTGRAKGTDAFSQANFDNFRNMDISKIIGLEQMKPPLQFAQATQFGTAEAYNSLLQRGDPGEKMNVAIDKLVKMLDDQRVTKEEVETELQSVAKLAKKFFEQNNMDQLGNNIAAMAGELADQ